MLEMIIMRRLSSIPFLIIILCVCLCSACRIKPSSEDKDSFTSGIPEVPKDPEQTDSHSVLYLEDYTVEQVVKYFNEVVLDSEYFSGEGNYRLVQKWTEPICYRILGEATETDRDILKNLFNELNKVDGFPGIVAATENEYAHLTLYFYDYQDFNANFGSIVNYEEADGAVEYWYYNDTNQIYDARIGYRTDIDQHIRNSVLLEEVVNGLGISDTILREDSIIYQGYSEVQELSEMDWLIIKLLYHPDIKCGMSQEECADVIKRLYY